MRGIISNLLKIPGVSNAISTDLQRLHAVERGLGDKAVAYVLKDKGGSVLSTLANVEASKVLGLDSNYSDEAGDKARRHFLARQAQDAAVLARLWPGAGSCNGWRTGLSGRVETCPPVAAHPLHKGRNGAGEILQLLAAQDG